MKIILYLEKNYTLFGNLSVATLLVAEVQTTAFLQCCLTTGMTSSRPVTIHGCHSYKISKFFYFSCVFPVQSNIQKLRNVLICMNIYISELSLCACLYVFIEHIFVKNDKFRMKCVNKYDASAKDVSRNFFFIC